MKNRIVKDSSLWSNPKITKLTIEPGELKVGIVREAKYDDGSDTVFYSVEVTTRGRRFTMSCRPMTRFGDAYNYEEWGLRNQTLSAPFPLPPTHKNRVGEIVVVMPIDGNYYEGVILGGLKHPARKSKLTSGIAYISEFNGLETSITDSGAYKVTFKGTPLTAAALPAAVPGIPIPPALYNPVTSGSFIALSDDGSFEANDAFLQSIKINKPLGKIAITSGAVSIELGKFDQSCMITCKSALTVAADSWFVATPGDASIFALKTMKLGSPKIAIGFGEIELIDTIINIVDALGTLTIDSPDGRCNPFLTAPTWTQVELLKTKLLVIKGSLV